MSTLPLRCEKHMRRTFTSELLLLSMAVLSGGEPQEGESTISESAYTAH